MNDGFEGCLVPGIQGALLTSWCRLQSPAAPVPTGGTQDKMGLWAFVFGAGYLDSSTVPTSPKSWI